MKDRQKRQSNGELAPHKRLFQYPDRRRRKIRQSDPGELVTATDNQGPVVYPDLFVTPASSKVSTSLKTFTAPSITPIARAAPVPSPRRIRRSSIGSSPRCSSIIRCPASCEQCPAKT